MSAAENKDLMQRIFAGIASGDSTLFLEHLADDVSLRVTGQNSWSREFKGRQTVLRDLYGYVRSLTKEPRKTIPLLILADEDHVVVQARGDLATKAGVPYENDYCIVYRLRGGKIAEITEYLDSVLCERVLGLYPESKRAG
jgi:uncharacterized protein